MQSCVPGYVRVVCVGVSPLPFGWVPSDQPGEPHNWERGKRKGEAGGHAGDCAATRVRPELAFPLPVPPHEEWRGNAWLYHGMAIFMVGDSRNSTTRGVETDDPRPSLGGIGNLERSMGWPTVSVTVKYRISIAFKRLQYTSTTLVLRSENECSINLQYFVGTSVFYY